MNPRDYIVHVVDDEEPVRKSVAFLLKMAGFTPRAHESAAAFLAIAPGIKNGCVVTDLRMPDLSGVDLLRQMRKINTKIPTIVITGHADVPMAVEAMKAGAVDFIEKPFEGAVLVEAIKRAAAELSDSSPGPDVDGIRKRFEMLSDRERSVLAGIVQGLPNKSIGYDLNISPRTVEVHRAHVMMKMQAKSLASLVRMALAAGLDGR